MSLKHAILGFLSIRPLTGYDLKKNFDESVSHFWPADQSQIYRTLSQLTDDGLVDVEIIPRQERLDLKLYHITDAGQIELHHWLAAPLPPQDTREPLLIQIFFGNKLSEEEMLDLLQHELQHTEAALAIYADIYRHSLEHFKIYPNRRTAFLRMLTLEYGMHAQRVQRGWLQSVIQRLQTGDFTPAGLDQLLASEGNTSS